MEQNIAQRRQNRRMRKNTQKRMQLLWLIPVLVLVFAGLSVLAVFASADLQLTLAGESTVIVEFGEKYQESGVSASVSGFLISDPDVEVHTEGTLNEGKVGEYTITYSAKYLWHTATATRTVKIRDTQAPTIVLVYNADSFTLPGQEYVEEGFVAEDNYDGDITAKVERTVVDDVVIYRVTDSSGNSAEARRPIKYGDETPPVLSLKGDTTITINAGTKYQEPGYSAVDNVDGDITDKVKVSGDYSIYTPGTYTITYSVTDTFGNIAEVTRTLVVNRVQQQQPTVVPGDKVIYLTFDDGPGPHTPRLLNILAQYNVKATFFVVGTANLNYLDDIVNGGHSIAIHTNTHDYAEIYASEEAFFADLNAIHQKILDRTGVDTKLMRFPGGSSNSVSKKYCQGIMTSLTKAVEAQGYRYFDWNVDSKDAGGAKTAEEVFQNVINGVSKRNVSVVLQHDIWGYSVDAVESIIVWGLSNGYTFLPLDETSPTAHHPVNN